MFNIWIKISLISTLFGLAILIKGIYGFRNPSNLLNKVEKFDKEKMILYMEKYIERNYYLILIGSTMIFVSAIIIVLFR